MCIAVFVWQAHPLYPFLFLLNRDEYHNRPSKPVEWWDGEMILGGRDEVAGGTWLACSRKGRVSFLINVMEVPYTCPKAKTRGNLPLRFLESDKSPKEFAAELVKEVHDYRGFNLIMVDLPAKVMVYVTNRPKGEAATVQQVEPGIHVLTNARLDSPWPKAQRLKIKFKGFLGEENEIVVKEMIEKLMLDTAKADENQLLRIHSRDWEYNLSSIFVEVDTPLGRYGTRSTATITVRENGEVSFYKAYLERKMWMEKTVNFRFQKNGIKALDFISV